jgi:hypothetical protein
MIDTHILYRQLATARDKASRKTDRADLTTTIGSAGASGDHAVLYTATVSFLIEKKNDLFWIEFLTEFVKQAAAPKTSAARETAVKNTPPSHSYISRSYQSHAVD